ncbi:MAG: hypothetical protein IJ493_12150 [Clostridia bacterium]|nr:hypothetical protein [Clostridia bacterium]
MALFGIDVSKYNGELPFAVLREAGVRFAMVKASQGHALTSDHYLFADSRFGANVEGFFKAGIPVGAYHFFTASTMDETLREADFFLSVVEPYREKISLYLACDAENYGNRWLSGLSRETLTTLIDAFCRRVEKAGFHACHYTNTDHIMNFIDADSLPWPVWQAHYGSNVSRPSHVGGKLAIHQYTGSGSISGATGVFDLNFGYGLLAERIIAARVGYEPQTFAYIRSHAKGEDILLRMTDKLVERSLNPIRNPDTPRLAALLRYHCGFDTAQTAHLLAYRYADDLFRKLYTSLLR